MNELIKAIREAVSGTRTAVNAAIKGLPPVEQFEANQELTYGLRCMERFGSEFIEHIQRLEDKLVGSVETAVATARKAALDEAVVAKEVISKTDHEAAVNAAVKGAREEAEKEVTAKFKKQLDASSKRSELLKDVPVVVASRVSDDVLLAEDAATKIAKFKDRLAACVKVGVTAENSPGFCAEIASLALDADGDAAFTAKLAPLEASFNAAKAASGGGNQTPPKNPAAGGKAEDGNRTDDRFL